MNLSCLPVAVILSVALPGVALAATLYADPVDCEADGPGDEDHPFCSAQVAADALSPGDRLVLRVGTYNEQLVVTVSGLSAAEPTVIEGDPAAADRPVIDGSGVRLNNEGLVQLLGREHVVLRGFDVRHSTFYGVDAEDCHGLRIEDLHVQDTIHSGILVEVGSTDVQVVGNDVTQTNQKKPRLTAIHEAISISNVTGFLVQDNCVHDVVEEGIDVKDGSSDGEVANNTIQAAGSVALYLNLAEDVRVHHNLVNRSNSSGIQLATGDGASGSERTADLEIYRNVVSNHRWDGFGTWIGPGGASQVMEDNLVHHNVFFGNGSCGLMLNDTSGSDFSNNILVRNEGGAVCGDSVSANTGSHNLFAPEDEAAFEAPIAGDPRFVDPDSGDFSPDEGSPAIDAGTDTGLVYSGDPDVGAVEIGLGERVGATQCVPFDPQAEVTWSCSAAGARAGAVGWLLLPLIAVRRRARGR